MPTIIGPVGGGLESPPAFRHEEGTAGWYVRLRRLDSWRLRFDPILRRSYTQAACVVGIAPYVAEHLRRLPIRRFEVMSETALETLPPPVQHQPVVGAVRLLYVGRVVRTKGLRDAIRALARLDRTDVRLDVVGDGSDRAACEELAASLGVAGLVTFHGMVPKEKVAEFYAAADAFIFPSYREPGGNVVYEAMASGLPLIVSDRGGPAATVDESCAIRVRPDTPEQFADALAEAISELLDPGLRQRMGAAARARVAAIGLWSSRIEQMGELYESVVSRGRDRLDLRSAVDGGAVLVAVVVGPQVAR